MTTINLRLGGLGRAASITGVESCYAGGGTEGHNETARLGRIGGGGIGGNVGLNAVHGTGGGGGTGIVIIRVATTITVSITGPSKLDLFNACQIKTEVGNWLKAKGPGWHWVRQP